MSTWSAIALDDASTWPHVVQDLLNSTSKTHLVDSLAQNVAGHHVLVFHCTRLTDCEVADVRRHGLRTLDGSFARKRIDALVASGDLALTEVGMFLDALQRSLEDGRGGQLWAVLGASALMDETGLGPAFAYWGGESVRDMQVARRLAPIGTPCIVQAEAPLDDDEVAADAVAHALIAQHAYNEAVRSGLAASELPEDGSFDVCLHRSIPAARVRRMIMLGEREFERLTESAGWDIYPLVPGRSSRT